MVWKNFIFFKIIFEFMATEMSENKTISYKIILATEQNEL